jgi:hypothetical protein
MPGIQNFTYISKMEVKQFSGYDHDSSVEMKYLVDIGIKRN